VEWPFKARSGPPERVGTAAVRDRGSLLDGRRLFCHHEHPDRLIALKGADGERDGGGLEEEAEEAHTGFDPVLREDDDDPSLGREPPRPASELPADLQRIVERLTKRRGVSEPRD
jgi:hypothetical protein